MRFGSVCSGIEAASVAWEPLGWRAAWVAEIEPFPAAVLAARWPEAPNLGDLRSLPARVRAGEVEAPELLCGGTPCQAFSVAGLRRSLDDDRGNLTLTYVELADAIDAVRLGRGEPPAILVWENVPGVLSTADNAFGCLLGGLAGESGALEPPGGRWSDAGCVLGPTRAVAWRILDAQYFGLAQRRRRVFLVASARAGFDPAAILFESEGMRRDSAPSREAGQVVAPTIRSGAPNGSPSHGQWSGDSRDELIVPQVAGALDLECGGGKLTHQSLRNGHVIGVRGDTGQAVLDQPYAVANCLTARMHKGINSTLDEGQTPVVTHSLRGEGFDASEDGTGRGTPLVPVMQPVGIFQDSEFGVQQYDSAGMLRAGRIPEHQMVIQPVAFSAKDHGADATADLSPNLRAEMTLNDTAGSLKVGGGKPHPNAVTWGQEIADPITTHEGSTWTHEGTTFRTRNLTAFAQNQRDEVRVLGVAGALAAEPGAKQQTYVEQAENPYTLEIRGRAGGRNLEFRQDGTANALRTNSGGRDGIGVGAVSANLQVRRLTPRECERLQGFPDDYTAIPWRGKSASECPDGPRYKALGNSWAVPVVRWIGARIQQEVSK